MKKCHIAALLNPVTALFVLCMLAGCETPEPSVRTNFDPAADLATYRTYTFAENPGTNRHGYSTPLTNYFKNAIRLEMDTRGYQYVERNADLLVNFNANAREQADVSSSPATSVNYYGYRGGLYGVGSSAGEQVQTVRYRIGTANIDVVDARRKQVVWEGIAEGQLTGDTMKNPQAAVNSVVTEMFTKFPGKAGA